VKIVEIVSNVGTGNSKALWHFWHLISTKLPQSGRPALQICHTEQALKRFQSSLRSFLQASFATTLCRLYDVSRDIGQ
jgi:hypothetical protein